jgi:hypothetical protein
MHERVLDDVYGHEANITLPNAEWRMANGEWRMANGEWRMAKSIADSRQPAAGSRKLKP